MTTEERTEEILAMHDQGFSPVAIAEEIDVSETYVRNVLQEEGIDTSRRITTLALKAEAVVEAYQADKPVPDILAEFDITYARLYGILAEYDVPLRKVAHAQARNIQMDQAVKLYEDGIPLHKITEETGIHQPQIHAELHKRGVTLRRPRK